MGSAATLSVAEAQAALDDEVRRFVDGDPNRSLLVRTLNGPALHAEAAADVLRPAGSVLKLLPAIALYRAAGRGEIDLDATVARGKLGHTMYPSILGAFDDNRLLTVRDLCAFALITSDNPATQYVLDLVGPDRVAEVAADLGLTSTSLVVGFKDEHLGELGRRNVSTAREALRLLLHVEQAPELGDLRRFLVNNLRNQRIPLRLDDDVPVMHKTGSLTGIANDVGVIYLRSGRVALAYLCDRQPDTVLTSIAIGDSALRIVDIMTRLRR